ncbi:hypothetical protein GCM10010384_06300 [Streptomyces djakartensis]|uniref:Uncharacterized protein n=1 Tax=Streptomyces djakartensis TaxID=68193 RepID=A0ABQ2Z4H8_9ACTN|nr:hypothetical protein GCM10010384_06300 [Streptomyces djakartensis]
MRPGATGALQAMSLVAEPGSRAAGAVTRRSRLLRIPVGGKRFRPCIEDVIEERLEDLGE